MITEVARRLHLETPSLTTMIDRLSERGLVERVSDSKDRRKNLVALTENGKCLVNNSCEPYRNLHEEMFGVLDGDERENLTAILQKSTTQTLPRRIVEQDSQRMALMY